jgi:predicted transcriptional regulator
VEKMKTLDLFRHDFVLSIKPEYATKIIAGEKTVELRRRFPLGTVTGAVAYVYATVPIQAVIGWATIAEVQLLPVATIWEKYKSVAHITSSDFQDYFGELTDGCVIVLEQPRALSSPVNLKSLKEHLKFVPPQSYCYADEAFRQFVHHE